jgi:hypothetical protein
LFQKWPGFDGFFKVVSNSTSATRSARRQRNAHAVLV